MLGIAPLDYNVRERSGVMGAELPYYPINDFGPVMKGMVIGGLGIVHVFWAQFAIGGGMVMCYFRWLSQTGRCSPAERFLDTYFRFLVLISFVLAVRRDLRLDRSSSAPTK